MALFTPTNQKRLTNVSVVRLKKGGNRYELACYPNKVRAWRDRLETNLDEVLQIQCVFTNVSKGQFANKKEMFQVFRTENEIDIIKLILEQGELQLTEKERSVEQQSLFRDVAKMVSERCVNPETNRAYTVTMIEKMMKDCHISLKANKTAKQHALEVIKHLRSTDGFKIAPAMMEVVVSIDSAVLPSVKDSVLQLCTDVIRQGQNADTGNYELTVVIEPEKYGAIESLLHSEIKGKYCIEIVGNTKHVAHRPATKAASDVPLSSVSNPCECPPVAPVESQLPVDGDAKPNASQACAVEESSCSAPVPELKSAVDRPKKPQRRKKRGKGKSRDDDWPDD